MDILDEIHRKYSEEGHDPEIFLKGLLLSKPLTYWDYIRLDTLLSLQQPRTEYPDERVFILYHQAIELFLNLLLHELQQVLNHEAAPEEWLLDKMNRICNYADILNTTFTVMNEGMNYDQYNAFRLALAPASGFQSVQYRLVEILCTTPNQLLHRDYRDKPVDTSDPALFYDKLYWREAGIDKKTGRPGLMLKAFDSQYKEKLLETFRAWRGRTLYDKVLKLQDEGKLSEALRQKLRRLDYTYNVVWPLTHLKTAEKYLADRGEVKMSTGASPWREYLHPAHQKRVFFPLLWSQEELDHWGL